MSQTEIETCTQYLSVINDKRFELSTFELAGEKDIFDYLEDFGLDIPTRRVDFRGAPQPQLPIVNGDSVAALDKGLLINPEISGEELS